MILNRRDVFNGGGVLASTLLASQLSACSPPTGPFAEEVAGRFFAFIKQRKFDDAWALLSVDPFMTVMTFEKSTAYGTKKDIIRKLSEFIHTRGFLMIGDRPDRASGGFWGNYGGWSISDMLSGPTIDFNDDCGGNLTEPVMNVFVRAYGEEIQQILLMESRALNYSRDEDALPLDLLLSEDAE